MEKNETLATALFLANIFLLPEQVNFFQNIFYMKKQNLVSFDLLAIIIDKVGLRDLQKRQKAKKRLS